MLSAFSLVVAGLTLPAALTALLLPVPILLTYAVVRVMRGVPVTMLGVTGESAAASGSRPRYQLVAMPINHFGEKLRWTMDLLGAPYEESTVGGLISIFLRGRSVPWLVDRQSCSLLGNSDEALWYLSAVHVPSMSGDSLHGAERLLQRTRETLTWEPRLNALGHALQGWAYYYLLAPNTPRELSLRFWGAYEPNVPLTQRLLLRLGYPVLKVMMQRAFRLHDQAVYRARTELIDSLLNDADAALTTHHGRSLTGDALSYVDITFCALLGPFLLETVLGQWARGRFASFDPLRNHASIPAELQDFERRLRARPCGQFIEATYRAWRNSAL